MKKYRNDVMKTIKQNNIDPEKTLEIAGLDMGGHVKRGDYLSGGTGSSTLFILTGRQANQYVNPEGVLRYVMLILIIICIYLIQTDLLNMVHVQKLLRLQHQQHQDSTFG